MSKQRLSKVLADAGIASRRGAEQLIFEGRVTVDGRVELKPQERVSPYDNLVAVDGNPIQRPERKLYFLLNKPKGFVCSNKRISASRLVIDLFKGLPHRLFTVGRLDRETTGLIIVTNDGYFANQIIHPSSEVEKEYLAKVDREITSQHLQSVSKGGFVEGSYVKPIRVSKVRKGTLKIVVKEGRKHEVRVLLKRAGLRVKELCRIRIGDLVLGQLPVGQYRTLQDYEKDLILNNKPQIS